MREGKSNVFKCGSPIVTAKFFAHREGTIQPGREAAQRPADVYSFLPQGSTTLSWLHHITDTQDLPARGWGGIRMSMNALLPRTLGAQVCNRTQLHCLRRIRVQGSSGKAYSSWFDTEVHRE